MGIIYSVHNKVNDKYYIGQTVNTLPRRIQSHLHDTFGSDSQYYFHRALRKHGRENFEWEIIDEHEDPEVLNMLEKLHISRYESYEEGYNLTEGGGGISGWNHSQQTIQKMRESATGIKHSLETRKKISDNQRGEKNNNFGKRRSPETRKKISDSLKGHPVSNSTRQKLSKAHKGKKLSPNHIKKIVESRKRSS